MADTTGTTATTSPTQTRRKTASTSRSTAAKKAAATRASNQAKRSTAAKKAAATRREANRTPVERYADIAGRAVTIQVGAALIARDNVVELANRYSSLDKVERELRAQRKRLEKDLRTFERRGTTARDKLRSGAGARAELLGAQVENIVQTGVTVGTQVAAKVTERVARVA
jgi:hypothetical protein